MLVNTETGSTFTIDEISDDLEAAGFRNPEPLLMQETMHSVIRAQKPE
jgi:hypothetical protein